MFALEKARIGTAKELQSRIKVSWQACMKNHAHCFFYIYIYISIYFPVPLQKWVFSVLVIWIERDEQVECKCAFKERGMTEVCYKVKSWNGDLSSQYSAILYYQTLLFIFSFQISSISQYLVCVLCFCAGTNTVGFILLLESVEKSSFSVTALLLLLILFYYSFHFL